MRRWAKVVLGFVAAAGVAYVSTLYVNAWYHRRQAEKLLAYVKTVQIGVTTETEFRMALRPLESHLHHSSQEVPVRKPWIAEAYTEDEYFVLNSPLWMTHRPDPSLMLDWVMFAVEAQFQDGVLTGLKVYELSCPPACGHPFASDAAIYARRDSLDEYNFSRAGPFNGYKVYPEMTDHFMDRQLPKPVLFKQYVLIDDRGTAEQRRKALDFNLECFTNWFGCRDAAKMLHPAPNP
jgi:hypothetical protein